MKQNVARGVASICFLAACTSFPIESQQPPASAQTPTIRVQSSLVLVDVISQDPKSGRPVRDFKKEDFRLFDNLHKVRVATLDAGARYDTRPLTLWLVVICNEGGIMGASAEFVGKESLFRFALDHLENHDTVGVAHWCDNGETQLDLLPTEDRDGPIRVVAETLKPIPFQGGTDASDRVGEETFRKMIRLIIHDAYRRNPKPLPVIVFLHDDHTGQPRQELDKLVDDSLETSGIVFGIRDDQSPVLHFLIGEQSKIGSAQQSVRVCVLRGFLEIDEPALGTARRSDFPAEWLRTNNHAAERTPAVEMAGRGNRGNVQTRPFPDSPHPWKSRTKRGIPTFPPRRRRRTAFTPNSEKPPKSRSSTDSRPEP